MAPTAFHFPRSETLAPLRGRLRSCPASCVTGMSPPARTAKAELSNSRGSEAVSPQRASAASRRTASSNTLASLQNENRTSHVGASDPT